MGTASKVMYKIANIFNWIFLVLGIILFICGICGAAGAIKNDGSMSPEDFAVAMGVLLFFGIWFLVWPIVLIVLTRKAEKAGTSKGWDILFLVLGIVSEDLFYFLGGLFGLIARK
jgi:ABC-type transport system involved in multi-copper enzyme maturation permease subunit